MAHFGQRARAELIGRSEEKKSPAVKQSAWVRNPIDAFILNGLEAAELNPAPEADRATLIRRLRFDLTFLIERATKWKLIDWDMAKLKYFWFTKPYLDLAPVLVMLNRGTFTGSSLHSFADKESGARVPKMYREGLFPEIIDYVTRERDAALDLLKESREVIGDLGDRRRRPVHKGEAKP